jgi:hypothetical protein
MTTIQRLAELAKRPHDTCEDRFYACPKSPDGCGNDQAGSECNCGADAHNAEVDRVLAEAECGDGWFENTGVMPVCREIEAVKRKAEILSGHERDPRSWIWDLPNTTITHYKIIRY